MKKSLILFVLLFFTNLTFGQIQSNCNYNASLMASVYEADINLLAINRLYEIKHADTAQIIVPQIHKDSIIKVMVGVYNLGAQLEADSVFTIHCLHDYQSNVNTVRVIVDTNSAWTSAWQNMQLTTTNLALNQLLSTFGFTLKSFSTYTIGNHLAILESFLSFNPQAFCDSFNAVITGAYALPDYIAGTGNRLEYEVTGNSQNIGFFLNWESCPTGCLNSKLWKYNVDMNCNVTLSKNSWLRVFAPPPPAPINCGQLGTNAVTNVPCLELNIYPNPTSSVLNISTDEKGTLTLFDLTGAAIKSWAVKKGETQLDISGQTNGIYFSQFKTEKGMAVQKIVKE